MADELPSVEEFEFLHEIDAFNAKIKQAVTAFEGRFPRRLATMLLQAHAYQMMPESPFVNRLALEADEKTGGSRRRELAERLVAAGALSNASLDRLRKRLSEARCERGDLIDVDELVDAPARDVELDDETEAKLDEDAQRRQAEDEAETSIAMARLYRLGVFSWDGLRLILAADVALPEGYAPTSELKADASELKADASDLKTDG